MIDANYIRKLNVNAPTMTEKIWGWYYMCLVPAFESRTVEDIRRNGVMVTGIHDLDEGLRNDWLKRQLTIDQMIEFFKHGVTIRIVKMKDTKDIYDTIQTHLTQWLEHIRTGMNLGDAPLEDLVVMDKFAAKVYPFAKHLFTREALESALGERIGEIQRVNNFNFFNNIQPNSSLQIAKAEEEKLPERESLEERFKQSVMTMTTHRRY